MVPEMRAAADKLILDVANLRYIVSLLGRSDGQRRVRGGWTVHQVLGHVAFSLGDKALAVDELLAADASRAGMVDWDALNAKHAAEAGKMPLKEITALLSQNRDRCIDRYGGVSEPELARPVVGECTLSQVMGSWLGHIEEHALDLIDALPGLRLDPMVLNWILWADVGRRPDLLARQQELAQEARERYGDRLPEPGEEDE